MAKTLSKTGITNGQTIQPSHVTQSIDAFTATDAYDISLSGSSTVSGSLTVALPIPGKDNYTLDISTGENVYTDLPFAGVNFTGSGLVILGEEDSNMGQASILNQNTILSIPALGGASFSQSLSIFTLKTGSIESTVGIIHPDQTPIGGNKELAARMSINPDGVFAGNREGRIEIGGDYEPQMLFDDASGQRAGVEVAINEFNLAGMQVFTPIASSTTSSFRVYNEADNQVIFDVYTNGMVILSQLSSSFSASDDADAATKGIPTGGLYHTNGTVKIRLS